METIDFLKLFINSNIVLLISLILFYIFFTNKRLLKRRGFSDEFIKFKKKDYTKRLVGIMLGVPVLELIAGFITYLIFGELRNSDHLLISFLVFLVLLVPFPVMDSFYTARKHKDLMIKTKSPLAVDLNFRVFHFIFNPFLEAGATFLVIGFYVLFIRFMSPLIIIHLALIWLMYLLIRRSANLNKPSIRESYYYTFGIISINQLLVVFHLIYPFFATPECCQDLTMLVFGWGLSGLLMAKLIYYLSNIPGFRKELSR